MVGYWHWRVRRAATATEVAGVRTQRRRAVGRFRRYTYAGVGATPRDTRRTYRVRDGGVRELWHCGLRVPPLPRLQRLRVTDTL